MFAAHRGEGGLIGMMADSMAQQTNGRYAWPDGTFRNVAPPDVQLAEVQRARCFQTKRYSVGDRGLHSVTKRPREGDTISLPRYLALSEAAARRVTEASPAGRDAAILDYFKSRKTLGEVIHRFFGDPGLQVASARFAGPEHQSAITLLRERLTEPGFVSALSAVEQAELEVLAAAPLDFISCTARRGQA